MTLAEHYKQILLNELGETPAGDAMLRRYIDRARVGAEDQVSRNKEVDIKNKAVGRLATAGNPNAIWLARNTINASRAAMLKLINRERGLSRATARLMAGGDTAMLGRMDKATDLQDRIRRSRTVLPNREREIRHPS